ncbi:MAG: Ig-like domain-containing protein [Candidatus Bathyarchaeota archaeon]
MKIRKLILILIVYILLASSNMLPLVNAQPTKSSLTITVSYNLPWQAPIIKATLKDENNNLLQNFDIDFLYECDYHNDTHMLGRAKTNSTGVASLTWTWSSGTYNITAKFRGTQNYAPSSSEYIEITIIDYTPYFVGGGLISVAIICAVGYIVFRRRKKRR